MEDFGFVVFALGLLSLFQEVESRYCSHTGPDGTTTYIMCASYEYCCGRSCCRSPTLTFYQLWYFWLSVIIILLLCSGGGWWYRFKYRGTIYTQPAGPGTNAFYHPQNDRVFFQNLYKDFRYPQQQFDPASASGFSHASHQYQCGPPMVPGLVLPPQSPSTAMQGPPLPPPYTEPPPSYESVIRSSKHWMLCSQNILTRPRTLMLFFNWSLHFYSPISHGSEFT